MMTLVDSLDKEKEKKLEKEEDHQIKVNKRCVIAGDLMATMGFAQMGLLRHVRSDFIYNALEKGFPFIDDKYIPFAYDSMTALFGGIALLSAGIAAESIDYLKLRRNE